MRARDNDAGFVTPAQLREIQTKLSEETLQRVAADNLAVKELRALRTVLEETREHRKRCDLVLEQMSSMHGQTCSTLREELTRERAARESGFSSLSSCFDQLAQTIGDRLSQASEELSASHAELRDKLREMAKTPDPSVPTLENVASASDVEDLGTALGAELAALAEDVASRDGALRCLFAEHATAYEVQVTAARRVVSELETRVSAQLGQDRRASQSAVRDLFAEHMTAVDSRHDSLRNMVALERMSREEQLRALRATLELSEVRIGEKLEEFSTEQSMQVAPEGLSTRTSSPESLPRLKAGESQCGSFMEDVDTRLRPLELGNEKARDELSRLRDLVGAQQLTLEGQAAAQEHLREEQSRLAQSAEQDWAQELENQVKDLCDSIGRHHGLLDAKFGDLYGKIAEENRTRTEQVLSLQLALRNVDGNLEDLEGTVKQEVARISEEMRLGHAWLKECALGRGGCPSRLDDGCSSGSSSSLLLPTAAFPQAGSLGT